MLNELILKMHKNRKVVLVVIKEWEFCYHRLNS